MIKCCGFLDFSSQSLPIAGPQRKQPAVSVQGPGLDWTAITLKPASASRVTARRPQAQPCAQKQSTIRQQRAPTLVSTTMFCKSAVSSSADPLFPGTYDCEESVRGPPEGRASGRTAPGAHARCREPRRWGPERAPESQGRPDTPWLRGSSLGAWCSREEQGVQMSRRALCRDGSCRLVPSTACPAPWINTEGPYRSELVSSLKTSKSGKHSTNRGDDATV